ncbi:uncharacterized protein LACBIDRAFT_318600 [Laccaria bicolor S238N-H82]|uniref:Predicted protein n=1 Tax=Laccaria bicolor (strain S238N-H82 / ATCC MYA-4686) TaxID=486041 RepID=B0E2R1_LACBS|nr:uncharacterized protein LACBIDRAFT_318600 [Laccaria bicolor S238N-H82]EDQ98875.1 predicted protein [Laccaria bicolor S238N-H82]|eukprot:XP_001890485.1 predicted protein [Laccaria bicolor S238N-H82]
MFGFALGTINAGEVHREDDRHIRPASRCCCIRICQASLSFHGEGSSMCGIGSKISSKSDLILVSHFQRASSLASISMCSHTMSTTLKGATVLGTPLPDF